MLILLQKDSSSTLANIVKKGVIRLNLDKLIEEGKELEKEVGSNMGLKTLSGVKFESWISKSVLFLEKNHPESSVTEKAVAATKSMSLNTSFRVYQYILGTLIAIKETEEE